jgi:hypothetical protein
VVIHGGDRADDLVHQRRADLAEPDLADGRQHMVAELTLLGLERAG